MASADTSVEKLCKLLRKEKITEFNGSRAETPRIDLSGLEDLPQGTLGRALAERCRRKGIDPNLIQVPADDDVGWLLHDLYQTHDIWHVATGWGNDLAGEVGLGGFYCAQLGSPTFFGYMLALIFLNVISRRANLDETMAAFSAGYRTGKQAEPMIGVAWDELWHLPLAEVRARFRIDTGKIVGEGALEAA